MEKNDLRELLEQVQAGRLSVEAALQRVDGAAVADLGFAQVDTHRALRKGFPEVIYGAGKTARQVVEIAAKIRQSEARLLITRLDDAQAAAVLKKFKAARHHKIARCVTIDPKPLPKRPGAVAVVCAGTSDLPVAEEAAVTADIMGNRVERVYDVGVAGLHRLLGKLELIRQAHAVIVVAGMEELGWNWCSKGVGAHYWYLFECSVSGEMERNEQETKSAGWYRKDEIKTLKLEPVWEYWFKKLNII